LGRFLTSEALNVASDDL